MHLAVKLKIRFHENLPVCRPQMLEIELCHNENELILTISSLQNDENYDIINE